MSRLLARCDGHAKKKILCFFKKIFPISLDSLSHNF